MLSRRLLKTELFQPRNNLTIPEQINRSYHRAREVAKVYNFTLDDVVNLTPKFWALHQDNICIFDLALFTLITIQYNLVAGTLAKYLPTRPDLQSLVDRVLKFEVNGQFLLTELGRGLDARNLETTATMLEDGTFDLHTPNFEAAKYMPPSSPIKGFPRFGLVMARLIVNDEDYGVRPFIVWLNDGENMCEGVTSRVVPQRTGCKPIDHSITSFNHVKLPSSALLGSLDRPTNDRNNFLAVISRISVGTLAISTTMVSAIKLAAFVAGKYSLRREIKGGPGGLPMPIIAFRTQQLPILHALADIKVFEAFVAESIRLFCDKAVDARARGGVGAIVKAVLVKAGQKDLVALSERCGAQGLYGYNHIIDTQLEARGISVAEGEVLMLCIRLASELLIGRYELPPAKNPMSLLAQHEAGLWNECQALLAGMTGGHRTEQFNEKILPRCQPLIEALGQRMAYEAAVAAGVDPDVLALYEIGVIMEDPAWYVEKVGLSREEQFAMQSRAADTLLPKVEELLDSLDVEAYCSAPILSDESMEAFVEGLETHVPKQPTRGTETIVRSML